MPVAAAKTLTRPTVFDCSTEELPSSMTTTAAKALVALCVAPLVVACTHTVTGTELRAPPGIDDDSRSPIDVDPVLLDQSQMRAITGGGDDLTVIPTMDGKQLVDIDTLAQRVPPQCAWIFAETRTFGREVEEFHKTSYQNPPKGALISQGAAGYRDVATARRAFDTLSTEVGKCGSSTSGYVGVWTATPDSIRTRTSTECGRDYRLKSVVLVEVTFCAYPASVPDIVMANLLTNVPG